MTSLLITGGAGFIGVNLVAYLAARPETYDITVLDDESLGQRAWLEPCDVRFVPGDIRDADTLDRVVAGQDAVIHLAADTRVMDSVVDPARNFSINAEGSFRLLEACRRHGVKRVIAASTGGAMLGEAQPPVHEAMVPAPLAPYGASKLAMEGYLSAFSGAYGMSTCALRFTNVYGPRSYHKGSVVAHFFKNMLRNEPLTIYGDGSQRRDFFFIGDLCDGVHRALTHGVEGPLLLGSGTPTALNDLIGLMFEVSGRQVPVRHETFRAGELHSTWCDIARARDLIGFEPATDLAHGLALTWDWFRARA